MSTATRPFTAEELFRMPDDGHRYELVEGELNSMMTPAGSEHGYTVGELSGRMWQHLSGRDLGRIFGAETGFLIGRDPDTVLAPDVSFVRQQRIDAVGIPASYFPEAPALVVEVVSPGDTVEEVDMKLRRWLAAGVELAWVVHPGGRTVTVYRSATDIRVLTENDLLEGDEVVPGFSCRVGDIMVQR